MHTVKVNDLTEGMIVAQNVLSRMGQIIVYKNSCLTKQMISQICYYQIPSVEIIDGEIPPQTALALEHKHVCFHDLILKNLKNATFLQLLSWRTA